MAEEVETGGLMRFRYSGEHAKLSDKDKKDIEEAYRKADERKRREKKKKHIIWTISILILILLIAVSVYFLGK